MLFKKILLLLLLFLTTSCATEIKDASKILSNLTEPDDLPSEITMMVYADERINKNQSNEATPVNFVCNNRSV